ncbi:MAG: hypothetical protein ABIK31_06035 [candidate division WOR-3 bacterium]
MSNKVIKTITVEGGQTIYDVLIQYTGTIESLFHFYETNKERFKHYPFGQIFWFTYAEYGNTFVITEDMPKNTAVVNELQRKQIKVCTFRVF